MKPTIAIDFDGVIHLNRNFIDSTIVEGEPVSGVFNAIEQLARQYKIVIFSCRATSPGGADAIRDWLDKHGIVVDDVVGDKPHACAYIDDRAINFNGDWQTMLDQVEGFEPWQASDWRSKKDLQKRFRRSRF